MDGVVDVMNDHREMFGFDGIIDMPRNAKSITTDSLCMD